MVAGPLSFRLRAASPLNETSSCRCSAFPITQRARTAARKTSSAGSRDGAKNRVAEVVLPSIPRDASICPTPWSPGIS